MRMPFLQEIIHKFEEGGGIRFVRYGLIALLLFIFVIGYNVRAFRNMFAEEAMDNAQLARNIAAGKGYTTDFIRPFSVYLVKKQNSASGRHLSDLGQLKGNHPDITNPPVYPLMLAGLMKVLPFNYSASNPGRFWSRNDGSFYRFQPDFLISLFNQFLFLGLVVAVFYLARKLFDRLVAWLSAVVLVGTELMWQFCVSGLSTILLMLIFVGLAWALVLVDEHARSEKPSARKAAVLGVLTGLLVALGALTRYSFLLLIIPVLTYLALFAGRHRVTVAFAALAAFVIALTPWIARNQVVSGTPFGTSTYALMMDHPSSLMFQGNRLERSLEPQLQRALVVRLTWHKAAANLRSILQTELPTLGGTWLSAFFLVGLMLGFRREGPQYLRYFLVACIPFFVIAQAVGRTHLSEDSPGLNTENLLVVLAPFAIVYGVAFFLVLLDRIAFPVVELRYIAIALFVLAACFPALLTYLPPQTNPVSYPPYRPDIIQSAAAEVRDSDLTMSDIPWAMAWYGRRQSIWLTLAPMPGPRDELGQETFFAVNDYLKPIGELYLSTVTLDRKFLSEWFRSDDRGWGGFIVSILIQKKVPEDFPLKNPSGAFMMDAHLFRSENLRRLELSFERKLKLMEGAAEALRNDPALANAVKGSKAAQALLALTESREFPVGRIPFPNERMLESMIGTGQLVLTAWDRGRLKRAGAE